LVNVPRGTFEIVYGFKDMFTRLSSVNG